MTIRNQVHGIVKSGLFILAAYSPIAFPAPIDFSGQLDIIFEDSGEAVYSGSVIGTTFSGTIDDVTGTGQISDGVTTTFFSCCSLAAESPDISNDTPLSSEEAGLLNSLAGSNRFSAGDLVDGVNLEGDSITSTGGRIEIGISYILNPDAFSDELAENYPFDPADTLLTLFFILEEDASGDTDIFDAIGIVDTEDNAPPTTDTDQTPDSGKLLARDLDGDPARAEAFYDPALGITWLKDTNLALSETFDVPGIRDDGAMNFSTAQFWINTMNSASYLGHTEWRMPTLTPVAGGSVYNNSFTNNASSDVGNAVTGIGWVDAAANPVSELGHMFYVTLENTGLYTPNGEGSAISQLVQPGWGKTEVGPFENIHVDSSKVGSYWNGLTDVSTVFNAPSGWYFIYSFGSQSVGSVEAARLVWPVHDGDIGSALTNDELDRPASSEDSDMDIPGDSPQENGTNDTPSNDANETTGTGVSDSGGALSVAFLILGLGKLLCRLLCLSPHAARIKRLRV